MSEPAIVVRGLRKVYEPPPAWMKLLSRGGSRRSVHALEGVDLEVHPGSICAVIGPNGAGKSTLFRVLMGLTTPTSGTAHVYGRDTSRRAESRRMSIGFMPSDERTLLLRLSCQDNLRFQGRLRGYSGRRLQDRVDTVLGQVGLEAEADRAAFALSAGMKARLQLGRALVHEPKVLILDEPTSAVDPVAAFSLLELIKRITDEAQLAVLLSSHRLEEIDALDELVLLLDEGRVVFRGDLRDLRALANRTEVTIDFGDEGAAAAAAAALGAAAGVASVQRRGATVDVEAAVPLGEVLAALGGLAAGITHLQEGSGSTRNLLQEIYRRGAPAGA